MKRKSRYMSLLLPDEMYAKLQEVKKASLSKTNMTQLIIEAVAKMYNIKRIA